MLKVRLIAAILFLLIIGTLGIGASFYARGYRFDISSFKFLPNGILVVKSDPTGAQILVDGNLKGATDANISLSPGEYDITIQKNGYLTWQKKLTIEKEVVTQIIPFLFKSVPSFSPITLTGAYNPVSSPDSTKIAYYIPLSSAQADKTKVGLYILETVNLPIGFAKEPKMITDGIQEGDTWSFSPNGQEILLTTKAGVYLLNTNTFTPQAQRVNIASKLQITQTLWANELKIKNTSLLKELPDQYLNFFLRDTVNLSFSPDETKVMYTASSSASFKPNLLKPLPGSSTQKESREVLEGNTYVYDLKEDRNFLISEGKNTQVSWFPNSINLVIAEEGRIVLADYDGTNRQTIYQGSYVSPNAFSFASTTKIVFLTNLGSDSAIPNLYSLSLK